MPTPAFKLIAPFSKGSFQEQFNTLSEYHWILFSLLPSITPQPTASASAIECLKS